MKILTLALFLGLISSQSCAPSGGTGGNSQHKPVRVPAGDGLATYLAITAIAGAVARKTLRDGTNGPLTPTPTLSDTEDAGNAEPGLTGLYAVITSN